MSDTLRDQIAAVHRYHRTTWLGDWPQGHQCDECGPVDHDHTTRQVMAVVTPALAQAWDEGEDAGVTWEGGLPATNPYATPNGDNRE